MELILETLLSITLGVILYLPLLLLLVINQLVRTILAIALHIRYGSSVVLSSEGYDAIYMYKGHPHARRTVLYLAVLAPGDFDIEEHKNNYTRSVTERDEFRKLKQIWVKKWGFTCLKSDPNFDIKHHVRVQRGINETVTETELMGNLLPELCKDLGDDKPQWEDIIVPNFVYTKEPKVKRTLRILRIHHGYMDGISMLLMLAETQSGGPLPAFPWVINPLTTVQQRGLLFRLFCLLHIPLECTKHLVRNLQHRQWSWVPKSPTGHTVHGWTEPLDMKLLGYIKVASNCSMPAILTSILISAIRRFQDKFWEHPSSDEIVLGMVSALLPYSSLHLRNHHAILRCELDARDLPRRARLWGINQELCKVGRMPQTWLNHLLPSLFGQLPTWLSNIFTSFITGDGVISNFPATRAQVNLWGHPVEEMVGWVPLLTRAGFGCVTLRYGDKLRFCLNADESSMDRDKMDWLLKAVVEEAQALAVDLTSRSSSSKGSLVGRFLVYPVDQEEVKGDTNNNNQNLPLVKVSEGNNREERMARVLDKLMSTFTKLKRA